MPMSVECNHRSVFVQKDEDYKPCVDCGREIVIRDIDAERIRQMSSEGWAPEHDDGHTAGQMADAAACYALYNYPCVIRTRFWPWDSEWWKPRDFRRDLVKAAALIVAEIERLDRTAAKSSPHATIT